MSRSPQAVANYFLDRADAESVSITPLKLVKLVYIAYGWFLALTGEKLFREQTEAWKHGPVVPSIYHEFKKFGDQPITQRATKFDFETFEGTAPRVDSNDEITLLILDKVWAAYKRFPAWSLRNKTHEPDTPWYKVYRPGEHGITLADDDIREHYRSKIRQYVEGAQRAA